MEKKILKWLLTGETGLSSKAMAGAVAGIKGVCKSYPHDPSDFNRCLKFLKAVPEAREHLGKVARLSKVWKAIIKRFDEIEKCFIDEVGFDWCKAKSAPKTYSLMKEVIGSVEPTYA